MTEQQPDSAIVGGDIEQPEDGPQQSPAMWVAPDRAETSHALPPADRATDLFGGLPEAPIAPATREPRKRPKIADRYGAQEALPLDCAPTAVELLPRLGRTHHAIGEKLGISRQKASNIIAGRFRPSRRVIDRVLDLVMAA